jgi:hypothetical protein
MGWNICGLAVNKNYEIDINGLGYLLKKSDLIQDKTQNKTFGDTEQMQYNTECLDILFTNDGTSAFRLC